MIAELEFELFPDQASDIGRWVDLQFYALTAVCGVVVLGLAIAIVYFCIRYRRGATISRKVGVHPHTSSIKVEFSWISVMFLIFVGFFVWGAVVYFWMAKPPPDAVEIHIVGKQWMWKAQHPNGRRETNELHLLVGQPVKLIMTSQDVIHSYYIPAFRTKQDVLPLRYTRQWFTPIKPGVYHLFCAEYCGMNHSRMRGLVHVMEPEPYAKWLADQAPAESIVAAGGRLFNARACSGCHAPDSTVQAPRLAGIYNRPVALADGTFVIADEQYLHDSILLPQKQIVAGYPSIMPTYEGQLSEDEVMQLVAYIKSLTPANGGMR